MISADDLRSRMPLLKSVAKDLDKQGKAKLSDWLGQLATDLEQYFEQSAQKQDMDDEDNIADDVDGKPEDWGMWS